MKIVMVGEAANYREMLAAGLEAGVRSATEIVALPRDAALCADHDEAIAPEDVVISLRMRRPGGRLPACRLLHVPGAGLDGIDLDGLAPETIVCNVFEHEGPIAEFVLASVLEWEIRLGHLRQGFSPDRWSALYRARVPHGEVRGKTLGLVGYGRIGRAIAALARPFGMRILAFDPSLPPDQGGVTRAETLPDLLTEADYLTIACPLSDATRGMIGAVELDQMKRSAVLINISRAEVVDEEALFRVLEAGRLRGASLDVWYRYPTSASDDVTPSDFPFHALPNTICTPHSCAWTTELMERRYAIIASNINRLVSGGELENVVRAGATHGQRGHPIP